VASRAPSVEPSLLILDERPRARTCRFQAVSSVARRSGAPGCDELLFVSHDLKTWRLLCSARSDVISAKIVEIAPAEALRHRTPVTPIRRRWLPRSGFRRGRRSTAPASTAVRPPDRSDPNACRFYGAVPGAESAPRHAAASRGRPGSLRRLPLRLFHPMEEPMSVTMRSAHGRPPPSRRSQDKKLFPPPRVTEAVLRPHGELEPTHPCLLARHGRRSASPPPPGRRQDRGPQRPRCWPRADRNQGPRRTKDILTVMARALPTRADRGTHRSRAA